MKSIFPCSSILHVVLSLLFLFSINSVTLCSKSTVLGDGGGGSGDHYVVTRSCINSERLALLDFKSGFVDEFDRLSTWSSDENNKNCCEWSGVRCSNQTGHVTDLHLQTDNYSPLIGKIDPSLLQLRHLKYLNLSSNDFENAPIPNFIGSFSELEYLDLSYSNFGGNIPSQLGNLSHLKYLDISSNRIDIKAKNLEWLSHLSLLEHLRMDGISLSNVTHWEGILMNLPSLSYLSLVSCHIGEFLFPYHHSASISINSSITTLVLKGNSLNPSIYHWLFNLSTTLEDLDLSINRLTGPIPKAFGKFTSLRDLDLSTNLLTGPIPETFGNLASLRNLDLSSNQLTSSIPEAFGNLTSLRTLALYMNQLTCPIPETFRNLISLRNISLSLNQLTCPIPETFGNLTSLRNFDLSWNQLIGLIPETFGNLIFLRNLDLSDNQLTGPILETFGNLTYLHVLDLSSNQLTGTFPKSLGNLFNLERLQLNNNQLNGSLPENMGKLINLDYFDVSSNSLEGVVSEVHFSHLSKLTYLNLSLNSIAFKLSSQWVPPFQLKTINLRSCKLGPRFPNWIQTQENIKFLDISCTGISDIIPRWFWDQVSIGMRYLNISSNQIQGTLPDLSSIMEFRSALDLSCNQFEGPIKLLPYSLSILSLHQNNFSGDLSFLCHFSDYSLSFIDLSQNLFTGELPDCISNYQLLVLNFAHNKLYGKIPTSIGSLDFLEVLYLYNNSFDGELPLQLSYCTSLSYLNMGANKLSGNIPTWIGQKLTLLYILNLRSNNFSGTIPLELCHLSDLRVLDLSMNSLAGMIPSCFNNFTSMVQKGHHPVEGIRHPYFTYFEIYETGNMYAWTGYVNYADNVNYVDYATIVWQGREQEFNKNLRFLTIIDLSSNNLTGVIPDEVALLHELVALNLSRNQLHGPIPQKIGELKSLLALDISRNHLSGGIPASLSGISSLGWLDLSYNNLSGEIPTGTQLQSFNASQYIRNAGLCGPPLTRSCSRDKSPPSSDAEDDAEDNDEFWRWFYIGGFGGYATGFWTIFGVLLLNPRARQCFFIFLGNLSVTIELFIAKLLKRRDN